MKLTESLRKVNSRLNQRKYHLFKMIKYGNLSSHRLTIDYQNM